MKSLLLFKEKKSDMFWLVEKIDFDLSKYRIYFVVFKKMVFDDKNSDMFCICFKRMKNIFFKKRVSLIF